MSKWNIFVVTHKHIFDSMYTGDPLFSQDNFKFVNVAAHKLDDSYLQKYQVLNLIELPVFLPLGPQYAESEAIYNIYKNKSYYQNFNFIGFLHYDRELVLNNGQRNITEQINHHLQGRTNAHISFSTYPTRGIYDQKVLADETQPETLNGDGVNCIDYIIKDYNDYFKTNYSLSDLWQRGWLNLDSGFLIDIATFEKMMQFCAVIIESRKLEAFDTLHRYRLPGGLLERYYGVFLAFEYPEFLDLSLPHHRHLKFE